METGKVEQLTQETFDKLLKLKTSMSHQELITAMNNIAYAIRDCKDELNKITQELIAIGER